MKVCIAEKPSVAGEIAQIVGATTRKDGYYEGNNYQVTWTFGHLCTLKEPNDYLPEWKRWHLASLPIIPSRFGIKLIKNKGVEKQFEVIERLVQNAEEVINCGDAGQEGELIQRWVLHKAGIKCPLKRLWISSLTEEAIREGFEKLRDNKEFDNLYAAGSSRAIGDWLLGINATRLYTLKYGQQNQLLSVGRVQTPTLALIVNRYNEIENFVPQPYWELKTIYKEVTFSSTKGRFEKKEEGEAFLSTIKSAEFEVTDFTRKKGTEAPPRLFDLTSLQVECNRRFGFSADETLKLIQSLYEKKVTTYPRVDTTYLSNDIYPKVPGILKGLKDYISEIEPLLAKKIRKSKKVFDDKKVTDHHAIIPTGVYSQTLSRDEKIVYDVVTRRFIANFYPDCIISTTTVLGKVDTVDFKTSGKQVLEDNWRVLYKTTARNNTTDDNILPEFVKGEKGPHEPTLYEKETQPPKLYTEATLLRAMETAGKQVDDEELREVMKENGIGRPSTRANIIETLFRRKFVYKVKKNLVPTITGIQLIATIRNELLMSAELTGLWEKKLRLIELGQYEVETFMDELKQMVSDIVFEVKRDASAKKIEIVEEVEENAVKNKLVVSEKKASVIKCPRCGNGEMLKGNSAWGCSEFKNGCKTIVPFQFLNKNISENQLKQLTSKGRTALVKGVEVDGEKVNGFIVFDEEFILRFEVKEDEALKCPACKNGDILKGNSAYGCANYKNGCRFVVPFEFMGKTLTESQIEDIIRKGKSAIIKGFDNGHGEKVDGRIVLDDSFKIKLEA